MPEFEHIQNLFTKRGYYVKQTTDFKLSALQDKLNQAAQLLKKDQRKGNKAVYIGVISELMTFFRSEYPDLNREPFKKLLSDLLEERLVYAMHSTVSDGNTYQQGQNISRKRKTDALIVAAMELIIGDGSTEHGAAQFAASILTKKNEGTLLKLLKSYRSPLLPAHIRELVQTLKLEGKKRFNGKQSAIVYLKRADQNIK